MNSIEISNLVFKYKSWVKKNTDPVFTDLNLKVEEKEHLLILAKPEGGKTTFSRVLNGLVPKFIDGKISGSIILNNKSIGSLEPYDLIKDVCYVSQNPLEMFVSTTCENEVAFPLQSLGIESCEIENIVEKVLSKWGLSAYAKASPFELSGGERKRLLLAVSNAIDPAIYVLDEAFDDLDRYWRDFLATEIKTSKKTIITLSARYLVQFKNCFDNIRLLENGTLKTLTEIEAKSLFTHKNINSYLKNSHLIEGLDERLKNYSGSLNSLSVKNLKAIRKRDSIKDEVPFEMDCPSFEIKSCEVIRLVGSNGSGKSTFSRILCGLDEYDSGQIDINSKAAIATKLQSSVGYLFQNPDYQIFLPTIYEELAWGLDNSGKYTSKQVKTMVENCAKLFSLDVKDTPSTMSFALRKRLQAAVYYLLERPFLILDELDGAMSYDDAYFIINELSKKGCALIIITHDNDFAKDIADKTYIVDHGKMEVLYEC